MPGLLFNAAQRQRCRAELILFSAEICCAGIQQHAGPERVEFLYPFPAGPVCTTCGAWSALCQLHVSGFMPCSSSVRSMSGCSNR